MFYGDKTDFGKRENYLGNVLQRYKTDFREDKMTSTMFYGNLKLILEKIKLLRRCFTVI